MKEYASIGESLKRAARPLGRIVAGLTAAALASATSASATSLVSPGDLVHPEHVFKASGHGTVVSPYKWRARAIGLPHPHANLATLMRQAAAGQTIPFWTSQITSPLDGQTYTTSMVGSSPYAPANLTTPTVVNYVPLIARVHFEDGTVLDPTKPACGDTVSINYRFFHSPLFTPSSIYSNGVHVGGGGINSQLISAFQRANFWSVVKNSNYGVYLKPTLAQPKIVDFFAPDGNSTTYPGIPATCGATTGAVTIGAIDINAYDALVEQAVVQNSSPTSLPILLTYNIVQTEFGGCCILGYHSAFGRPGGTQTYAVGSYIDSGIFQGVDDIVVWTHEMAEWMDDPFVQANVPGGGNDDLTPAWGNVGQVQGCQNNLEDGDPLSGTEAAIKGADGRTYHIQDLAFHDWFYRTPSTGTAGKYSFLGVFTSVQGVCNG